MHDVVPAVNANTDTGCKDIYVHGTAQDMVWGKWRMLLACIQRFDFFSFSFEEKTEV
jgi:hypothetical protein